MEWKIMLKDCKTEPALALIPANNMTHSKIVVVLLLLYRDDTKCKQESFFNTHKRKSGKTLYTQKSNVIKELGAAFQTLLLTFSLFSINIVNTSFFYRKFDAYLFDVVMKSTLLKIFQSVCCSSKSSIRL